MSLGGGGSFSIENKFGEVHVHGESSRDVKISATIRVQAGSREEADAYAQKVQIDVLQMGNAILVRTVYPEDERRLLHGRNTSYSVNYDIAIPSDAPLTVKNSFGSVTATGVHGRTDIDNSHGSLSVSQAGPSKLNNSFGSIELHDANGDSFVNDNNGSVEVSGIKGALDLRNRFGSITVREVQRHGDDQRRQRSGNHRPRRGAAATSPLRSAARKCATCAATSYFTTTTATSR